jgi:hypothetical protein
MGKGISNADEEEASPQGSLKTLSLFYQETFDRVKKTANNLSAANLLGDGSAWANPDYIITAASHIRGKIRL